MIVTNPIWYTIVGKNFPPFRSLIPVRSNRMPVPKLARNVSSIMSCGVGMYSMKTVMKKTADKNKLLHAFILFCIIISRLPVLRVLRYYIHLLYIICYWSRSEQRPLSWFSMSDITILIILCYTVMGIVTIYLCAKELSTINL